MMETLLAAYIECALWSSTDDAGDPLDKRFSASQINRETLEAMERDCKSFWLDNDLSELSAFDVKRAGHDFWLTRNNHGAGFWDGDWPEPMGAHLTAASHAYGAVDLYVGDDGQIHMTPLQARNGVRKEASSNA